MAIVRLKSGNALLQGESPYYASLHTGYATANVSSIIRSNASNLMPGDHFLGRPKEAHADLNGLVVTHVFPGESYFFAARFDDCKTPEIGSIENTSLRGYCDLPYDETNTSQQGLFVLRRKDEAICKLVYGFIDYSYDMENRKVKIPELLMVFPMTSDLPEDSLVFQTPDYYVVASNFEFDKPESFPAVLFSVNQGFELVAPQKFWGLNLNQFQTIITAVGIVNKWLFEPDYLDHI